MLAGDVVHLTVLNRDILIVNSYKASNELMSKSTCSDRPDMPPIANLSVPVTCRIQRKISRTQCRAFRIHELRQRVAGLSSYVL